MFTRSQQNAKTKFLSIKQDDNVRGYLVLLELPRHINNSPSLSCKCLLLTGGESTNKNSSKHYVNVETQDEFLFNEFRKLYDDHFNLCISCKPICILRKMNRGSFVLKNIVFGRCSF